MEGIDLTWSIPPIVLFGLLLETQRFDWIEARCFPCGIVAEGDSDSGVVLASA